jgi:hypothetical protein
MPCEQRGPLTICRPAPMQPAPMWAEAVDTWPDGSDTVERRLEPFQFVHARCCRTKLMAASTPAAAP